MNKFATIAMTFLLSFGQLQAQLILTEEENLEWIDAVKNEPSLGKRIEMLRTRLLTDTSIYVRNLGDRLVLQPNGANEKNVGLCRPMLIVEGYFVQMSNDTDRETVESFVEKLTIENINRLEVVEAERAKALFGQNGWCGVILIEPANRKARKALLKYKIG